jgi:hypothetical protein
LEGKNSSLPIILEEAIETMVKGLIETPFD